MAAYTIFWSVILILYSVEGVPQLRPPKPIGMVYVTGTHYQVGKQVGYTFRNNIQEYFQLNTELQTKVIPFVKGAGKKIYDGFISTINATYPQYLEEMQGIAEGANVSETEVFVQIMYVELTHYMSGGKKTDGACTDLYVNYGYPHVAIGHNEDADPLIAGRGYIVDADIINDRPRGRLTVPREQFVAYTYPGTLPGNAFGFTKSGLIITINALYPEKVDVNNTIPRYVLTRALLSAPSMDKMDDIVKCQGHGSAYGFSVNTADMNCTNPCIDNIEVAPGYSTPCSTVNHTIITDSDYHVNIYRRIQIKQDPESILSSQHRAKALGVPDWHDANDIRVMLGNTVDPRFPIYRNATPPDTGSTVATGLFDIAECSLHIYDSNPAHSDPLITMDLPYSNYCRARKHLTTKMGYKKTKLVDHNTKMQRHNIKMQHRNMNQIIRT
ncbi:unnamed protein product [Owenia fusiformis]|uniref:Uncharacterized protein n=1 Tax=Owenia fusiformis TaxID=6347 RepID=A0A8J1TUX0_OWEFU|nr:unnamed protein product [Owenia fusiformis]